MGEEDPRRPQISDVRKEHAFSFENLNKYLSQFDWFAAPIDQSQVSQFTRGQSNPTFLIQDSQKTKFVVRKKPPGKLLKSAHQLDREYKIISALAKVNFPVPKTYCLCEDDSIIGTMFYVMEFVDGRIFRDQALPELNPKERFEILDELNRVAALLHSLPYQQLDLGTGFGRGTPDYIERQISVWTRQYNASKTSEISEMDYLISNLPKRIPNEQKQLVSVIHGDYRLENVIFHPSQPKILAVLDWELSTIGNPLADFAYTSLFYYTPPIFPDMLASLESHGFPSEEKWVSTYLSRFSGAQKPALDLSAWTFFVAFQLFRTSGIAQGVYHRSLAGNASSPLAPKYGKVAKAAAHGGWVLLCDGEDLPGIQLTQEEKMFLAWRRGQWNQTPLSKL